MKVKADREESSPYAGKKSTYFIPSIDKCGKILSSLIPNAAPKLSILYF
jgi:hypothetical protein